MTSTGGNGAKPSVNGPMFAQVNESRNGQQDFMVMLSPSFKRADALPLLAGPAANIVRESHATNPRIPLLYLQAAARHLPPAPVAPGAAAVGLIGAKTRPEEERQCDAILKVVGCAASKCVPRSAISGSGILPVLEKLSASGRMLSAARVEFLQCGLLAGQYRYVRRTLTDVWPRPCEGVTVEQVLRYFYYRGMIHVGCEEWQLAIRCFHACLTVPSEVVSAISIAAWKKLMLCQCLVEPSDKLRTRVSGTKRSAGSSKATFSYVPAAASQAVVRFFSSSVTSGLSSPDPSSLLVEPHQSPGQFGVQSYLELVQAFRFGNPAKFSGTKSNDEDLWRKDGNAGMVNRVEKDMLYRKVYQLFCIYSVISMRQLSFELQMPEEQVRSLLLQMSAKGMGVELEDDGMVSYTSSGFPDPDTLDRNLDEIVLLASTLRELDVAVTLTPRYQQLTRNEKQGASRSPGGPRGVADL